jgi:23S rRNA G2445 N2-methylase RlmL
MSVLRVIRDLCIKCNIGLRTAIKILKPIHKFKINDEKELYDKIKEISWEDYLDVTGSLAVGSTLSGGYFYTLTIHFIKDKRCYC